MLNRLNKSFSSVAEELAWIAMVPRNGVSQVRFSIFLVPAQIAQADGWRTDKQRVIVMSLPISNSSCNRRRSTSSALAYTTSMCPNSLYHSMLQDRRLFSKFLNSLLSLFLRKKTPSVRRIAGIGGPSTSHSDMSHRYPPSRIFDPCILGQ